MPMSGSCTSPQGKLMISSKASSSTPRESGLYSHSYLYFSPHCKPGEAYTRLITASCEAGPGTTHMCTQGICLWSLQIPNNADKCALDYSIFGFSKYYLYIDPMKNLKLSCQGSNHHPSNNSYFNSNIKSIFYKD
jgi:hypothetical protein